jgi:hypothetical protein
MSVTDADRLLADGEPVTIAGHAFHVRFTPRSFKLLEDRYGAILNVGELLNRISTGDGALFGPIFHILSLGLRHETVDGQPVTEDWLLDNGDAREITVYAVAALDALMEALPAAAVTEGPNPNLQGTNGVSPGASPGSSSSTPPSSASTSPPASSGTA